MQDPSQSNISRWIAFLVGPLVALAAGFVALKAKQWFNVDVSEGAVQNYVLGIVLTVGGLFVTWLHNRGKHEIAKVTGLSEELVERIETIVEERLPNAPQSPTAPTDGAPARPQAPPGS